MLKQETEDTVIWCINQEARKRRRSHPFHAEVPVGFQTKEVQSVDFGSYFGKAGSRDKNGGILFDF